MDAPMPETFAGKKITNKEAEKIIDRILTSDFKVYNRLAEI